MTLKQTDICQGVFESGGSSHVLKHVFCYTINK